MGKNKYDMWNYDFEEEATNNSSKGEMLNDAYDALNRFYQKEQKRGKPLKKRKSCWQ